MSGWCSENCGTWEVVLWVVFPSGWANICAMADLPMLPTPREMIAHLDRFAFGQVRAKQDLAVAVYHHYLSQAFREREGHDLGRHHLLMIGPTGVGKTLLVKTLANFLGVPVGFASAAGLVESGYKGNSVESIIKALLDRAGGDARKAEKGIIFIDEVDKIRAAAGGGHRDVSGEGVQNALLTLLDGRASEGLEGYNHVEVDTGRLLFICAGAFVDLSSIVEARIGTGRSRIGFQPRPDEELKTVSSTARMYETLCQAQTADLVKYGMIPEFIGRFASITVLHELLRKDLRAVLSCGLEQTPLERQKSLARIHGIELEMTDEALDAVSREAEILGTGARGLARLLGAALDRVDYRWPELADDGVTRVIIHEGCITKGLDPEFLRGESDYDRCDVELRQESLSGLPPPPAHSPKPESEALTNTVGWSEKRLKHRLEVYKREHLDWGNTAASAKKWWEAFEQENAHRLEVVFRLADELRVRKASISEFFMAFVYSNTDNIQANLHYLDYNRLKKADEKKRSKRERREDD
jgi:ATP-dependent Clp protease ATP-binding subunit ClpX